MSWPQGRNSSSGWLRQCGRSQLCEPRHQTTARHCGGQATAERDMLQTAFPTRLAGTEESRRDVQEAHEAFNEVFWDLLRAEDPNSSRGSSDQDRHPLLGARINVVFLERNLGCEALGSVLLLLFLVGICIATFSILLGEKNETLNGEVISHLELLFQMYCVDVE